MILAHCCTKLRTQRHDTKWKHLLDGEQRSWLVHVFEGLQLSVGGSMEFTHPARVWTLLHHGKGVVNALAGVGPDLALSHVFVRTHDAFAHAAASRALLEHKARVLVTLTLCSPTRAVAL